ncbi:hypothetical protein C7534_103275 [Pseudomonas sp. OV226]|jgi:hypothetical protein|nr:hypothetical protein C7534_103275 [Pseudomonas sp. OV226]
MTARSPQRFSILELLTNAKRIKTLNVETAFARDGGFVGLEDVWRDLSFDQSQKQESAIREALLTHDEQLISKCLPHSGGRSA